MSIGKHSLPVSTKFILETKPLQLAAGFKFESKFEPLQIHDSSLLLFQKAVTSFECKIKLLSSWIGAAL